MRRQWKKLLEEGLELAGIVGVIVLTALGKIGKQPSETGETPLETEAPQPPEEPHAPPRAIPITRRRTAGVVFAVTGVIVIVLVVATAIIGGFNPGSPQPVPFSHHIHANNKKISCFFCHPYAGVSTNAGIPPVEKCLLCHKVVASNFTPIANLRGYYDRKQPVPWVRVATIPDFVHFSHECHIARGIDCSACHGNVNTMDRITPVHKFDMNFCVTCHKKDNVTTNCVLCHY